LGLPSEQGNRRVLVSVLAVFYWPQVDRWHSGLWDPAWSHGLRGQSLQFIELFIFWLVESNLKMTCH
jgi:hypothetical protein